MHTTWLTSDRLAFCRPEPADVEAVFRVHGDPRTYAHHPDGVMRDRDQADDLLAAWRAHWQEHGFGYAVLRPRAEAKGEGEDEGAQDRGEILGFAGLTWQEVCGHRVLNLYYRFDPAAWGQGYATEAARALVGWASTEFPDATVLARVAVSNPASARVAEAAGLAVIPEIDPHDPVPHRLLLSRPW